jgi:hypothetical protein
VICGRCGSRTDRPGRCANTRWHNWRRWYRRTWGPAAVGMGSLVDLGGQATLRAAQRLARKKSRDRDAR